MLWGTEDQLWSWYFKETNKRFPYSYQVERPRFDQILLDHARELGVEVQENAEVANPEFLDGRIQTLRVNGTRREVNYVIDASGQSALLANCFKSKQFDPSLRNLAGYAYFKGAEHLTGGDSGNILIESIPSGWLWKIPLREQVSSVGAVVDRDHAIREIRKNGVEAWFAQCIDESRHIRDMLTHSTQQGDLHVTRDWSYSATEFSGENFCLVGDAACFIDPLFSTGVHLAVSGGYLASALVNTRFRKPDLYDPARRSFEKLYRSQYEHFQQLVHLFYSGNRTQESYFWHAKQWSDDEAVKPRESFIRLVSGQAVNGYERAVLDKATLPENFKTSILQIESKRSAIKAMLEKQPIRELHFRKHAHSIAQESLVLEENQFILGSVLTSTNREPLAVSKFVASVFNRIEEGESFSTLLEKLSSKYEHNSALEVQLEQILQLLLSDEWLDVIPTEI